MAHSPTKNSFTHFLRIYLSLCLCICLWVNAKEKEIQWLMYEDNKLFIYNNLLLLQNLIMWPIFLLFFSPPLIVVGFTWVGPWRLTYPVLGLFSYRLVRSIFDVGLCAMINKIIINSIVHVPKREWNHVRWFETTHGTVEFPSKTCGVEALGWTRWLPN